MSATISPVPRGSETILLVDSDPESRKLALFMLGKQGYRVIEARNASEAVLHFERHGDEIGLLLTEVLMHAKNGHELAQQLTALKPDLRVLFMSDGDYGRIARKLMLAKGLVFLQKPFTMRLIAGKVREVLDAPETRQKTGAGAA
jgi:DNA-binding NtrC family response regulator